MKKKILLAMVVTILCLLGWYCWSRQHHSVVKQENKTPELVVAPVTVPKQQQIPQNDNYIEKKEEEEIMIPQSSSQEEWSKNYLPFLIHKFKIDHAHQEIFRCLVETCQRKDNLEECDFIYAILLQCKKLSVAKQMELAVYIIWKSQDQSQIDGVYERILSIASDQEENTKTRANALEILMRSNNRIYIERSKRIMENLQTHERIQEMEQIRQRMERIQNALERRIPNIQPSTLRRIQTPQPTVPHAPLTPEEIQVQHALMDQYRRLERRAYNGMKHKRNVYDDTQNVHNHTINQSVIDSAQQIMANENQSANVSVDVERELQRYYPDYEANKKTIQKSLNRIRTDPSKFKNNTTISDVFDKVVGIISRSRHKEEMWKRMGQEMMEMNQLCATGHLSRIVNVLQGFEDVPHEFQIKMDPKDEIYANLSNYITMSIQNSGESDKLLESMIDPENRLVFLEFVSLVLKPKVTQLEKEYQGIISPSDVKEHVFTSLKNYIKNDVEALTIVRAIYET